MRIRGELTIAAPIDVVFATVADTRNEPAFNPSMTSVELLTPEPIGLGTKFRALMGNRKLEMLVEITDFEPPHRIGPTTSSTLMDTSGALTFSSHHQQTVMSWDWEVTPKSWLRLLGPGLGLIGKRAERRIWSSMRDVLEADHQPADRNRSTEGH